MPNPHQSESNKDRATLDLEPTVIQTAADSSNDPSGMTQAESDTISRSTDSTGFPRTFGDYLLLGEVARGGMGVVYRARHKHLDRIVALKMILKGNLAGKDDVLRFRSEAEAAARLEHPGIVPVYEVGECDGQHYFTMGFIDGDSLAARIIDGPIPQHEAATLVEKISTAMAYAHRKNVVHRDLKPANVLVDQNEQPKVTDFGLAKNTDTDSHLTGTGQILGTPSYMPPEQAAGNTKDVGPLADIYSLGAILYCLLTGRPPFQAASVMDTLMQVMEQEPLRVRQLNPSVSVDLESICSKCLSKNSDRRYASADELATDLRRYLSGEPVEARGHSVAGRVASALKRSQYDVQFGSYGRFLYACAVIIMTDQLVSTWIFWTQKPVFFIPVTHTMQLVLIALLFRKHRIGGLLPRNPAERHMWSVWIGFILTCCSIGISHRLEVGGVVGMELVVYPSLAAVSGLAFCCLGSSYWGQCYTFAAVFFVLPFLMVANLSWAPIEFGLTWAAALVLIGRRLDRLPTNESAEQHN
jgi:hypothetical protein